MTLKEYAGKVYSEIERATSESKVAGIIDGAIQNLRNKNFSDTQIEQFKNYLREYTFLIKKAQENEQTRKNQMKAMALLKKGN